MMATPALLALDWGTTNLRATLLDATGAPLAHRQCAGGVMAVKDGQFAEVLLELCADWLADPALPLVASGMIGSRQGWVEAPYLPCPATPAEAAARLTRVILPTGGTLHLVPGLMCTGSDGQADVMRGEETQLWGAALAPGTCCVLPGTHSKWAWTGASESIAGFATYMTGELYALLTQHGILGRLMEFGHDDAVAFEEGVQLGLAHHGQATHLVFSARTAGLTGRLPGRALPDFLSGILIGVEIGSAMRPGPRSRQGSPASPDPREANDSSGLHDHPAEVVVIGEAALGARYCTALRMAGLSCLTLEGHAATRGQWRVARAAGLVP